MTQYHTLLEELIREGHAKDDRTGTGTLSVFGRQLRFDLGQGFPLLTTKKIHWRSVAHELLWFISGSTNINYLKENGVSIWDEWADENGELGPVYGHQWRHWPDGRGGTVDQLTQVIADIKRSPDSRRLLVSAWNVADVPRMALPPCHVLYQFYVAEGKLSCQLYQRSADFFLGVPFNIASYALLTHMVAYICHLEVGDFIWTGGDVHLYRNHLDQAHELLSRSPRPAPTLRINGQHDDIDAIRYDDLHLVGYDPHPAIKAPVAV